MSIRQRLRAALLCIPLILGAFAGVPMRPEEIEELMHSLNQQKITVVVRGDSENEDGNPNIPLNRPRPPLRARPLLSSSPVPL